MMCSATNVYTRGRPAYACFQVYDVLLTSWQL